MARRTTHRRAQCLDHTAVLRSLLFFFILAAAFVLGGVVAIAIPLRDQKAQDNASLKSIFLFLAALGTIGLIGVASVICRLLFSAIHLSKAVKERTNALRKLNQQLELDLALRLNQEQERERAHFQGQLPKHTREVIRSDTANNVLHNDRNVLNSVNISSALIIPLRTIALSEIAQ